MSEETFVELPPDAPPLPEAQAAVPDVEYPIQFDGRAGEYFRIWIVNLALGIATLSLYGAWAKVRTQRYFYGNTRLAGVAFEYLAKPLPILKGRLIALAVFAAYVLAGQVDIRIQLSLALVILLLTPLLVVRGAMFRARYSSWRGLQFRFMPAYGQAYFCYLFLLFPMIFTFGLLYPLIKAKQKEFLVQNHRFGGVGFGFRATTGQFYKIYLIAWAVLAVGSAVVVGALIGIVAPMKTGNAGAEPSAWVGIAMVVPIYAMYFVIFAFIAAAVTNLVFNHIDIGPHRMRSTLRGSRLLWIYFSNTVAILASIGLLIPWAMVRLARYRADNLFVIARGDLGAFAGEPQGEVGAAAAEIDNVFDIDIGVGI
ncbi:MAG: YjgN family protein [Dokdonella sp.]